MSEEQCQEQEQEQEEQFGEVDHTYLQRWVQHMFKRGQQRLDPRRRHTPEDEAQRRQGPQ